jgi:hypothetical protein
LILLGVEFKEIEMENFADTHQLICVDGVFVQNLVHIRPATTELFGKPYNCLLLLVNFFTNVCSNVNHNEESFSLLLFFVGTKIIKIRTNKVKTKREIPLL